MESKNIDSKNELSGDAAINKVRGLLPHFKSAMMITHASNGDLLHVRPLALQGDPSTFGGVLWFFTDERSRKVQEAAGWEPVSIVCQNDQKSVYLHLAGVATVVRDRAKMRELYSPVLKTWFPDGLEDPHLTLIKFEANSGAYWDSPGGMLQSLAAFGVSMVTGRATKAGESGDLHL
jgi:general stress protein 26